MTESLSDGLIILFLSIFAICIQLYFLNPPVLSDQLEYFITASKFPTLPAQPNIGSIRIGLIIPVSLLIRIFGYSEAAYYVFPLFSVMILAISIYWIGKTHFSIRAGFFSALAVLMIPILLDESGHLLPDVPATAFSTAAFAVLLNQFNHFTKTKSPNQKHFQWQFLLAGLLFGWSYLIKEYIAIVFFLIPALFLMFKIPWRYMWLVAAGMAMMFAFESVMGLIYYQNPLVRFLAANPRETTGIIFRDIGMIIGFLFIHLSKDGGIGFLILITGGLLFGIISSIQGDKRFIFLLSWFFLIYLLFTATGLLPVIFNWDDSVLLRLNKSRYWIPIIPPLIIGGIASAGYPGQ